MCQFGLRYKPIANQIHHDTTENVVTFMIFFQRCNLYVIALHDHQACLQIT